MKTVQSDFLSFPLTTSTKAKSQLSPIAPSIASADSYFGSFVAYPSPNKSEKIASIEGLINFLTGQTNVSGENSELANAWISEFTELTRQTTSAFNDPSLLRVLKSYGWTGTRYNLEGNLFDRKKLIEALTNLYLKAKFRNQNKTVFNVLEFNEEDNAAQINHLEMIASFSPDIVVNYLQDHPSVIFKAQSTPITVSFSGACMLVDISGFSKYSAAMCAKGIKGLDELRKATNGLLGTFVKSVYEHEGDVIAFAGDALICIFPDHHRQTADRSSNTLIAIHSTIRALHSASELKAVQFVELSTHIGISYGEMKLVLLGGSSNGPWVHVVNGPCLAQLHDCLEDAAAGMVVVTSQCYEKVKEIQSHSHHYVGFNSYDEVSLDYPVFDFLPVSGSSQNYQLVAASQSQSFDGIVLPMSGRRSFASVTSRKTFESRQEEKGQFSLSDNEPSIFLGRVAHLASTRSVSVSVRNPDLEQQEKTPAYRKFIESLTCFVPTPVINGLETESSHQLAELRTVTTMFLCLDSYDPLRHADPATLQPFFLLAQRALMDTGGFLRQFLIDDKGCVFIGMWGVPSFTYANNSSRALYCAATILQKLPELGHRCSIGITTGTVFCGTIGAMERCDFVGIGSEVNLAARFMAKAQGRIFLDESTYDNLNDQARSTLIQGEALCFKGMPAPIQPYIYSAQNSPALPALRELEARVNPNNKLLKKKVMQLMDQQLDKISTISLLGSSSGASNEDLRMAFLRANSTRFQSMSLRGSSRGLSGGRGGSGGITFGNMTQLLLLVGQRGTGKATAVQYFRVAARERGLQTIQLAATSQHRNVSYGLVRDFFRELVGIDNFKGANKQVAILRHLIQETYPDPSYSDQERKQIQWLLERVLGVNAAEARTSPAVAEASPSRRLRAGSVVSALACLSPEMKAQRLLDLQHEVHHDLNVASFPASPVLSSARASTHRASRNFDILQLLQENEAEMFWKIVNSFTKHQPIVWVLENAHFCDELTWYFLSVLVSEKLLNVSMLMTLKSNPIQRLRSSTGSVWQGHGATPRTPSDVLLVTPRYQETSTTSNTTRSRKSSVISLSSSEDVDKTLYYFGLEELPQESLRILLLSPDCSLLEMTNLDIEEVRSFLQQKLKASSIAISEELVRMVFDVSSGNAYWCKMICQYLQEQGQSHTAETTGVDSAKDRSTTPPTATTARSLSSSSSSASPKHYLSSIHNLRSLVLYRFEFLSPDLQMILKYASIIGIEFTLHILYSILRSPFHSGPVTTTDLSIPTTSFHYASNQEEEENHDCQDLQDSLNQLEKHGFIACISEDPTYIFVFQNELIQKTMYDLLPPSDAANIHLMIADYLEIEYMENLRPLYPSLAHHYKLGLDVHNAFKYEIKSAALAISSEAFGDGYKWLESSLFLYSCVEELDILLEVTDRALQELDAIIQALGLEAEEIAQNSRSNSLVAFSDQPRPVNNPFLLLDEEDNAAPLLSIRNPSALTAITETEEEEGEGRGVDEEKEAIEDGSPKARSPDNLHRLLIAERKKRRHQFQIYRNFQQKVKALRENLFKERGSPEIEDGSTHQLESGDSRQSLVISTAPPSRAGSRPPASLEWQPSYVEHKTSPAFSYLRGEEERAEAKPEGNHENEASFPVSTPFSRIHHLSGVQDQQQHQRSNSNVSSTTDPSAGGSSNGRFYRMFSSRASSASGITSDPPRNNSNNTSSAVPASHSYRKKLETRPLPSSPTKTAATAKTTADSSNSNSNNSLPVRSKSVRAPIPPEPALSRSEDYYEYYGIQPMKKATAGSGERTAGCHCIIA